MAGGGAKFGETWAEEAGAESAGRVWGAGNVSPPPTPDLGHPRACS